MPSASLEIFKEHILITTQVESSRREVLIPMKKVIFILSILWSSLSVVHAQPNEKHWMFSQKAWPNTAIYQYQLQGPVKSWIMKGQYGVVRKQEFDPQSKLVSDTSKNRTYPVRDVTPHGLMGYYERSYAAPDSTNQTIRIRLNDKNQILEKGNKVTDTLNVFDENGKISMSQTQTINTHTYSADSRGAIYPPIVYKDTTYSLTLFEYNELGSLITFVYCNRGGSSNDHSTGIIYKRDSADNVVEKLEYSSHTILSECFDDFQSLNDDYLKKVITQIRDSSFSVNDIFSKCLVIDKDKRYWKSTYTYNALGNCVEYIIYGHRSLYGADKQSLRATWEYSNGSLIKEFQYNYENKLKATLDYDGHENVVKETIVYGKKEVIFDYEIEYYE